MHSSKHRPPAECANCGATIPPHAKSCPECGADERTGWRENSVYDGLDLPETAWSDETTGTPRPNTPRVNGVAWYWWLVGILLLLMLVLGFVGI